MDEPDKKIRRMNTEGGSVNSADDKPKTDDIKVESAAVPEFTSSKIPKASEIADLCTTNFEIVKTKLTFVDKTKYIKSFFQCGTSVVQVTAPRRFGKSTFMDMLKKFSKITVDEDAKPISNPADCDSYKLFKDLQLGLDHPDFLNQHCGQYPVIFMSLKGVKGARKGDVLNSLKKALCEAFKEHLYLLETAADGFSRFKNNKLAGYIETFLNYCKPNRRKKLSESDVRYALKFLSEVLYTHFNKKVVMLIDETDAPIIRGIKGHMDDETLQYLIDCISDMMSEGLKDNVFVAHALLNSCVRLSGVFSWEICYQYDALFLQDSGFSEAYGYTTEAMECLFKRNEFQAVKDADAIKRWYGGYQILNNEDRKIYSSWSVIKYLQKSVPVKKKVFDSYWAKTGFVNILGKLFVKPKIQEAIDNLVLNESISIVEVEPTVENILKLKKTICDRQNELEESQVDFFLQLLCDDGLLIAVEKDDDEDIVKLKIPNWEIKSEIQRKCYTQSLFETRYNLKATNINRYIEALKQLLLITENDEAGSEKKECDERESEKKKCDEAKPKEREEEALQELVNGVAALFSDGATVPCNVSELHHVLFSLPYSSATFSTQYTGAVVTQASEEWKADTTPKDKLSRRKAKVRSDKKPKDKHGPKNKYDMCLTLGTVGVIIQLMYCQKEDKANTRFALSQIIDGKYFKFFEMDEYKDVKTKIYVGLCFKENLNVSARYLVNITDYSKSKCLESPAIEEKQINEFNSNILATKLCNLATTLGC